MPNLLVRRKMLTTMGTPVPKGTEYVVTDQKSNAPIRIYEAENPTISLSIDGRVYADAAGFVFFYGTEGRSYRITPVYNTGDLTATHDVQPGDIYDLKSFPASLDSQNRLLDASGTIILDPGSVLSASFETVSKNVKAYAPVLAEDGLGRLSTLTYTTPNGPIVKTLNYEGSVIKTLVLSGSGLPAGIQKTKTFNYTNGKLVSWNYS